MVQFILANIFMVSLGAVIYVVARTLPRLEPESGPEKKSVFERWLASEVPEKIDSALNGFLVKFLRKLKILLLKVDNSLSGHLQKIKPEAGGATNGNGKAKPVIDFKEIVAEKNEEKAIANGENLSNNQISEDRT